MQAFKVLASSIGVLAMMVVGLLGGLYWNVSHPGRGGQLKLPERATDLGSPQGSAWMGAAHTADYGVLAKTFETQEKGSWCGVASAVTVLNAGEGRAPISQEGLFTPEAEVIRSWWEVTFSGMTLEHFGALLSSHGAQVEVTHASTSNEETFRNLLAHNTARAGDFFVVNYDRMAVDEEGAGHISPIAAYAPDVDQALIFDTASYKYPAHWVPVADLFAAMNTIDGGSGKSRGWVQVSFAEEAGATTAPPAAQADPPAKASSDER
jgi:hypothetical protein